jgi:hypothetical protein
MWVYGDGLEKCIIFYYSVKKHKIMPAPMLPFPKFSAIPLPPIAVSALPSRFP